MNNIICSNCYKIFLRKITELPNDLKLLIFAFLPSLKKVFINHYFYNKYHYVISLHVNEYNYRNYICDMIRKDNELAFKYILDELNYIVNDFTKTKTFFFKKKKYKNTESFLLFLCKYHESNRCRELLINHEQFKFKLT